MVMVQKTAMLLLLAFCSEEDIKTNSIRIVPAAAAAAVMLVLNLVTGARTWQDMLAGAGFGIFMFLLSIGTRGKVGKGDALLIGCMGICFGFFQSVLLWWESSLMLAAVGMILIAAKKLPGRKAKLPFVPFLLAAFVLNLWFLE